MIPRLEVLEDRTCPDATVPDPGMLVAQMQAVVAFANQANAFIQSTFPVAAQNLVFDLSGLVATSNLLSQVAQQGSQFFSFVAADILAAGTLGPRG